MRLRDYFLTVVLASSVIGILEFLCYPSKAKDAARIFASVVLIHALLSPILAFAGEIKDGMPSFDIDPSPDTEFGETYEKVAKEAFEEGICKLLYTEYSLDGQNVEVHAEGFKLTEIRADRITVILSGKGALADHRGMEEYLDGLRLGDFEVRIRIG